MFRKFGKFTILVLSFAITLNYTKLQPHGAFTAGAKWRDDKPEKLTCDEVNVKGQTLDSLLESLYLKCGKTLKIAEPFPARKVDLTMVGSVPANNTLLAGKFDLAFQPIVRKAGSFGTGGVYSSGGDQDPDHWQVCLADSTTPANGGIRLFKDNGKYRLTTNAASIKQVLQQIDQLFGCDFPNFATDVGQQLFVLGIDLSDKKVEVKVSLKETPSDFHSFVAKMVKLAYEASLGAKDDLGPDVWPLTFVQPSVGPAKTGADGVDELVTWLNGLYPQQAQVKRSRNNLIIYGASEKRLAIQRLLAFVDVPSPQVQLDTWTIQVSGKPEQIAQKTSLIKEDIALTRQAMVYAQSLLSEAANNNASSYDQNELDSLKKLKLEPGGALSVNEALILLTCYEKNEDAGTAMKTIGASIKSKILAQLNKSLEEKYEAYVERFQGRLLTKEEREALTLKLFPGKAGSCGLDILAKLYGSETRSKEAIKRFAEGKDDFKADPKQSPIRLRQDLATLDRLLKLVVDSYAADMQQMFLEPLLKRIEWLNNGSIGSRKGKDEGVIVNGRVRMVVSSSFPSTLSATAASYADITRPAPLSLQNLLDSGLPRKENFPIKPSGEPSPTPTPATSVATEALAGAARVFGSLSPFPAVLLAGALSAEPAPTFREISPGISLKIQPTVLPDSGSARLAIEAEFKVDTNVLGNKENPWQSPPADFVKSHKVETDAIVSVFDLFDISSFSLESSYPQSPGYIPVLGRLPAVGPVFQWPRDKKRTHHESIILVNAVILPRTLDLARYYGN